MSEELIVYITKAFQAGLNRKQIIQNLKEVGWDDLRIKEAFTIIESSEELRSTIPADGSESIKKAGSKLVIAMQLISALLVILILSTGIALATRVWDPMWNPFRLKPEQVLAKMVQKRSDIKTVHSEFSFSLKETDTNFSLNLKSDSDNNDPNNIKFKSNVRLGLTSEGASMYFVIDQIGIGKTSYYKITNFPMQLAMILQEMGIEMDQFEDKWIKFEPESFDNFIRNSGDENLIKQLEESKNQSEEQTKQAEDIIKLFQDKQLLLVKQELPDGQINGQNAYHYILGINKEEFKKIAPDFIDTIIESNEQLKAYQQEVRDFLNEYSNAFIEKAGEIEVEIWIGKKDYFAYRVKSQGTINLEYNEKINFNLSADLSKFNESIQIQAPSDYVPIESFFESIAKAMKETEKTSRDTRRMSDIRMIIAGQEMFFNEGNKYLTSSVDKKDGTLPIGNYLETLHDPLCVSGACLDNHSDYIWKRNNVSLYCKESKLNAKSGQWYCVYTELENKGNCSEKSYFAASQNGSFIVCNNAPTVSNDCTCFGSSAAY